MGNWVAISPRDCIMQYTAMPMVRVGQQRAAGAGLGDRAAAGEEQAGADRAADRDHAQLPGANTAL